METRQVTQVQIYFLFMNGVYDNAEDGSIAAVSTSKDKLISLYHEHLLPTEERFRDEFNRYRSFKDGPFYNYNPLPDLMESPQWAHGLKSDWIPEDELENVKRRCYFIEE